MTEARMVLTEMAAGKVNPAETYRAIRDMGYSHLEAVALVDEAAGEIFRPCAEWMAEMALLAPEYGVAPLSPILDDAVQFTKGEPGFGGGF